LAFIVTFSKIFSAVSCLAVHTGIWAMSGDPIR